MKGVMVTILVLLLLTISASASEWKEGQFDFTSRGFISASTTQGHWTDVGQTQSLTNGYTGQSLIADLDGDGTNEIITSTDSSTIDIYNSDLAQLATFSFPNLKGTSMAVFNVSSDNYLMAVGYSGTPAIINITFFNFTGSSLTILGSDNISNLGNSGASAFQSTAVKCRTSGQCYFSDSTGNTNRWRITKINTTSFDPSDRLIQDYVTDQARKMFGTFPSILDYDNDGVEEILIANDADNDGNVGFMVISTADLSIELEVDDITTGKTYNDPIFHNVDGAGTAEIIFSHTSGTNIITNVYRSTGALFWTDTNAGIGAYSTRGSNIICDFGRTQFDVCTSAITAGGNISIYCHDNTGTLTLGTNITTTNPVNIAGDNPYNLVCADMDSDGVHEIISPERITDSDGTSLLNLSINSSSFITAGDVNADSELDLIFTRGTELHLLTSGYTNQPPVLNNSLQYGGYLGWYSGSVCNGTAITFSASEQGVNQNYDNDLTLDSERLVSDCGIVGDELANGTFSGANPTFSCFYNNTGAHLVTIYIQDGNNSNNFSQFNTQQIPINVVNGIAGVTCNLAADFISSTEELPATIGAATEAEIDNAFNVLLAGSVVIKFLVAIIFIIGGIWATAKITNNSFVIALVGVLIMGATTVFGLLTAWIMVVFVISGILLLVLKASLFSQSE